MSKVHRGPLFIALRKRFKEPAARLGSECLYWSQYAVANRYGEGAFFKTDAELVNVLGKSRSAISAALKELSSPADSNLMPVLAIAHHPPPGKYVGRVRWLKVSGFGRQLIEEAREIQATETAKSKRAVVKTKIDQSSHSATTINHLTSSPENTPDISHQVLKKISNLNEDQKKQVDRLLLLWNEVCVNKKNPQMTWSKAATDSNAAGLGDFVDKMQLTTMSDTDLKDILGLCCGDLFEFTSGLGPAFKKFNASGLQLKTLVLCGPAVFGAAMERLKQKAKFKKSLAMLG